MATVAGSSRLAVSAVLGLCPCSSHYVLVAQAEAAVAAAVAAAVVAAAGAAAAAAASSGRSGSGRGGGGRLAADQRRWWLVGVGGVLGLRPCSSCNVLAVWAEALAVAGSSRLAASAVLGLCPRSLC